MIGIKVTSLETGKVLFEQNAHKLLRPASNMKLYTVAAALDRLSPDYRFVTSVYAPVMPNANGVIKGDLTIYGRGDPSIAARFNNGNYFDTAAKAGTMLGSGAVVVMAEGTNLLAASTNVLRFFRNESCGKCVPCRVGSTKAHELLHAIVDSGSSTVDEPTRSGFWSSRK